MLSNIFRASALALGALVISSALPVTASSASAACVVNVASWDVLWMRGGPSARSARVGSIPPGACGVRVTGSCRGNWCAVRYAGMYGWVNTRYLSGGGGGGACVTGVSDWDSLWLRAGPSVRYRRIGSLPPWACGVRVTRCSSYRSQWCKVRWRGRRGWVNTRYLR